GLRSEATGGLELRGRRAPNGPDQGVEVGGREHVAVQLLQRLPRLLEVRQLGERVNRPRRAVDVPWLELPHGLERLGRLAPDPALEPPQLRARRRVGLRGLLPAAPPAPRL